MHHCVKIVLSDLGKGSWGWAYPTALRPVYGRPNWIEREPGADSNWSINSQHYVHPCPLDQPPLLLQVHYVHPCPLDHSYF